jgi:hypothetical protein
MLDEQAVNEPDGNEAPQWAIQFFTDADIARARMLAKGFGPVPADPGWLDMFVARLELAVFWGCYDDGQVLARAVAALPPADLLAGQIALAALYTDVRWVDPDPAWEDVLMELEELPLDGGGMLPPT